MLSVRPQKPGLFITGTDTGVGKTVVTCAIAMCLRRAGMRVGVCKPFATGCRREREGLVSEDAEALAHFADCRESLNVISPVRYALPVAPAVAAELAGEPIDFEAIADSLRTLDRSSDALLVEGVGGIMVPIDPSDPKITVLDLALELGFPVVVVARATLGTLNHTALTVRVLQEAGCDVAGVVINGFEADSAKWGDRGNDRGGYPGADASMSTNRQWMQRMNRVPILATVPACDAGLVAPERGVLPDAVIEAVALNYWPAALAASPSEPGRG